MHQNRFRLGLRPRPRWGSLQRFPRRTAVDLRGLLLKEGEGRVGVGSREEGKEGEGGRGWDARPVCLLVLTILATGLKVGQSSLPQWLWSNFAFPFGFHHLNEKTRYAYAGDYTQSYLQVDSKPLSSMSCSTSSRVKA